MQESCEMSDAHARSCWHSRDHWPNCASGAMNSNWPDSDEILPQVAHTNQLQLFASAGRAGYRPIDWSPERAMICAVIGLEAKVVGEFFQLESEFRCLRRSGSRFELQTEICPTANWPPPPPPLGPFDALGQSCVCASAREARFSRRRGGAEINPQLYIIHM